MNTYDVVLWLVCLPLSWLVFGIYFSRKIRSKIISAGVGLLASLALLMVFHIPLTVYKGIEAEKAAKQAGFFDAEEHRRALQAGFSTREEQINHVAEQQRKRDQAALQREVDRIKRRSEPHGEPVGSVTPKGQAFEKFRAALQPKAGSPSTTDPPFVANIDHRRNSWSAEFDINKHCEEVSQAVGGSYRILKGCLQREQEAKAKVETIQVEERILKHCADVGAAVGGSYRIMEGCIQRELEAKHALGR